jgi:hypothetical protein
MIQRIQTIYLAVAAVLLVIPTVFNLNWASLESEAGAFVLSSVSINRTGATTEVVESAFPIAAAIALALLATVYAIMQYKNRKFQMKLAQAASALNMAIVVVVFLYADKMSGLADGSSVSYSPTLAILLVNVVLCFLAYRGIKKDDELVRSADRLR